MAGIKTSTENLAVVIWERIEQEIKEAGCQLHSVKLYETENNFVEYFGGE
jgi:6-pyruvoyltetrahydropterin/6-carboxytetrahydropterin synthase